MTEHLAVTKAERRRHLITSRCMVDNFHSKAEGYEEEEHWTEAELWHCRASTIHWLLGYVERHVNLETGELTISLSEPEEAAG